MEYSEDVGEFHIVYDIFYQGKWILIVFLGLAFFLFHSDNCCQTRKGGSVWIRSIRKPPSRTNISGLAWGERDWSWSFNLFLKLHSSKPRPTGTAPLWHPNCKTMPNYCHHCQPQASLWSSCWLFAVFKTKSVSIWPNISHIDRHSASEPRCKHLQWMRTSSSWPKCTFFLLWISMLLLL